MALEGVNANIPLQIGQQLPHYGPDYNALANMQRTQIAIQNAQLVQNEQNALRAAYGDSANIMPGTNQLRPEAINHLMTVSPQAGTKALELNSNLAQQQSLTNFRNSEVFQKWVTQAHNMADEVYGGYKSEIDKGVDPKQALDNAQKRYTEGMGGLVDAGLPPNLRQMMSPVFDPTRIEGRQQAKAAAEVAKARMMIPVKATEAAAVQAATAPGKHEERVDQANIDISKHQVTVKPDFGKAETVDGNTIDVARDHNGQITDYFTGESIDPKTIKPGSYRKEGAGRELSPSKEIAVLDKDGNVVGRLAARESTTQAGNWLRSDNGQPVEIPPGGRIDVGQAANAVMLGGREGALLQRQLGAGIQAVKALRDVVALPSGSSAGIFAGRGQEKGLLNASKETLTNNLTSQEVQAYNALMPGMSRSLAFIDSQGLAPGQKFTESFNAEMLKEGDTVQTKMLKLARQREIVEAGMETLLTNPRLAPEQKKAAKQVMDDMEKAVPWTPSDVIRLMNAKPGQTLKDMGETELKGQGGASNAPAPPKSAEGLPKVGSQADFDNLKKNGVPYGVWPDGSVRPIQ